MCLTALHFVLFSSPAVRVSFGFFSNRWSSQLPVCVPPTSHSSCITVSISFSLSLSSVSADPSSHPDETAVPACSASMAGRVTWARRMTLQMMSTAPLRRATVEGAPCSCRAAWSAAAVQSARPASGHRASCCPPMGRCTVRWTATVWCLWSVKHQ